MFLLFGCIDPWAGTPASTESSASDGGSTAEGRPPAATDTSTTEPTTSALTGGESTEIGTTGGTTTDDSTGSGTSAGATSTGELTVGEDAGTGTTTGDTSTGSLTVGEDSGSSTTGSDTSAGVEEQCPTFVSTPDPRFEALLQQMQLEAVSPSAEGEGAALPSGRGVAIVVDGELRHVAGVGTRAKEGHPLADEPVDADTRFWVASTSKWIHGTMMASLVEDGLIDFDTVVTEVLPEYTESNGQQETITLHRLLTMTSGLARDAGCYLLSRSSSLGPQGCGALSTGPGTVLERLFDPETLASDPYESDDVNSTAKGAPGTYKYSNWGIMLSGRMAEVVGDAPYPDLVAARIFAPAQMCTATYDPIEVLASNNYAVGGGIEGTYCPEFDLGHDSLPPWEPDELACRARDPNGGVRASALDLGRFAAAFLADLKGAHIMISQELAHRMLCPGGGTYEQGCQGRVAAPSNQTYGYTNFGYTWKGLAVYTHDGNRPGFESLFLLVPERDFAVVIISNMNNSTDTVWATKIMNCWLSDIC